MCGVILPLTDCLVIFVAIAMLSPVWGQRDVPQLRYQIQEEAPRGTVISNLTYDAQLRFPGDAQETIRFRFLTEQTNSLFEIGATTGIITTSTIIDRDSVSLCRQRAMCELSLDVVIQPAPHFRIIKIVVEILDVNDNAPTFRETLITLPINEAALVGSTYIVPTATDIDSPAYGIQRYELDSTSDKFSLQVSNKMDGSLEVKMLLRAKLDREAEAFYQLKLVAYDGGPIPRAGSLTIEINVLDSNDNRPEFTSEKYEFTILENKPIGSVVLQVKAVDRDVGPNGLIEYSFATQTQNLHGLLFGIRNVTGEIYVKGGIDHEKSTIYQLVVIAQDRGPDPMSAEVTVIVHVEDMNDNAPTVTLHTLSANGAVPVAEVSEDSPEGTFVAHVSVFDPDSGLNGRVNCTINERVFALVQKYPTEYQIETAAQLDRERTEYYAVNVKCQDGAPVSRVTEKTLRVVLLDVNDNSPVFSQQKYKGSLVENSHIGVSVLQVTATDFDAGDNGRLEYSIPGNLAMLFHVDQRGVISVHTSIDREKYDSFSFPVLAADRGTPSRTGSTLVVIYVEDQNDEKPRFLQASYSFNVSENKPPGTQVGVVTAKDNDGPLYNTFSFAFFADKSDTGGAFLIDSSTGAISTQLVLDRETKDEYQFYVTVFDQKLTSMSDRAIVRIRVLDENDNNPEFVFPSLSNNTVYISNRVPAGQVIAQLVAHDADTGDNARLHFKILEDRTNQSKSWFRVEPMTDRVVVASALTSLDFHVFAMAVLASDSGSHSVRAASAVLNIQVNQSIPFRIGDDTGRGVDGHDPFPLYHVILAVAIATGSLVVIVTLVVVVAVVRQRDKQRHQQKYNCRMEALRMLTSKAATPEGSPCSKSSLAKCKPLVVANGNNSVKEFTEASIDADQVVQSSTEPRNGQHMGTIKHTNKDTETNCRNLSKPNGDVDKESVHSIEGSVTDSGRGPSEEGGDGGHAKHNRERYFPPPPPPPRGSYWMQQAKSSTNTSPSSSLVQPSVWFQGLHSTPEETDDSFQLILEPSEIKPSLKHSPKAAGGAPGTFRAPVVHFDLPPTTVNDLDMQRSKNTAATMQNHSLPRNSRNVVDHRHLANTSLNDSFKRQSKTVDRFMSKHNDHFYRQVRSTDSPTTNASRDVIV